jgi:tetratricopeptide (TPR) repeat protein
MPSFPFRRALAAAATFLSLALPVFAAEPWDGAPMSADPKAMLAAAEKVSAGESDAVVLLDEVHYVFDAQGRSTMTERLVYRITGDSAVDDWSTAVAGWAPWFEEKPEIAARVISKDGTVHMLDAKAITESPATEELEIFSDNRVLRAPLPGIAVGSVVEEVIVSHARNPVFDAGTTGRFSFGRGVPTHTARLIVDAPPSLTIHFANKSEVAPKTETADGLQRTVYEATSLPAIENWEWNLPYDLSPRPYVAFATGKSWQDIARRYSEIVDKQIAGAGLDKIVKSAVGTSSKRAEVIAKILADIQKNVRYAGVEVAEGSIIPRPPQEVLGHKYGDCKDKATLLVAMLREAGIPASVTLLRAGDDLDVSNDLPGFGQFNHAIVHVDGDQPMWIDPTDEFARAGELPVPDQGRMALIANGKTTSLVQTPFYDGATNLVTETRQFTLSEEGKAQIVETTEFHGANESGQRRFYVSTDRKQYRESMEQYATTVYAAKELKNLDASDPKDLAKPFTLKMEIAEAARGTTAGGEAVVAIFPSGLIGEMPPSLRWSEDETDDSNAAKTQAKKQKRTHDFVFVPYVKEWHYRIVPPPGYTARTLPQNETTPIGTASMTREYTVDKDGVVLANLRFDSGKRRLTPPEVETLRKELKKVSEEKAILIGFDQVGQAKLNAGDVGAALTEFRKLVTLHPSEARHHVEIARALLAGGMGEAARAEVKRAIELEPAYAGAYAAQGWILQHDLFGRRFRKGFDLAGATAAYRKAKELDAKNVQYRAALAEILEFGDDGVRWGRNAKIGEAVDELRAMITDLKENRVEGDLLFALAMAGRFDELRKTADGAKDPEDRELGRIIATAATTGSADALREAHSLDQASRRKLLGSAGQTLMSMRLYAQAADLFEAAAQGGPNAAQVASLVQMLRQAKRYEDVKLSNDDPRDLMRRMLISLIADGAEPKTLSAYLPADQLKLEADATPDDDGEDATTALSDRSLNALRNSMMDSEVPPRVVTDLALGSLQFQQDGDDKGGWRIRMRPQAGLGDSSRSYPTETFFITKENGKLVISGALREPEMIGWTALKFAEAGDTESARRWLNWAREEISGNANADDPLEVSPFAMLWAKSKQNATVDEVRLGAAALMLRKPFASKAKPILLAAREKATSDDVKLRIDAALAEIASLGRDWKELESLSQRLLAASPDSAVAFNLRASALTESAKYDEAEAFAKARLEKLPKDEDAIRSLGRIALARGRYEECDKYYRQVIDELKPTLADYNNAAWNMLFAGKDLDRAIGYARQASTRGGSSSLHTLAALYAETGKSLEAREALLKSMDDAGRDDPASHDWYVLARIAENYGANDAALAAYNRVKKPAHPSNDDTYVLAQKRLAAMKK